jgi:hypothetical protein
MIEILVLFVADVASRGLATQKRKNIKNNECVFSDSQPLNSSDLQYKHAQSQCDIIHHMPITGLEPNPDLDP